MQLDIFEHSRDVMLRNDVLHVLSQRDAAASLAAQRRLRHEFPDDGALAPLAQLTEALALETNVPFDDHAGLRSERVALDAHIVPAARHCFGTRDAAAWLVPLRRALASRATPLAFDADAGDDHAAPLWLAAGDAPAAIASVARIESWRRIPQPLAWMAEARHKVDGLHAAWPLWAELAWLSPARFDAASRRVADASLQRLRKHFDAEFEGEDGVGDLAWFPAWVLTAEPELAARLRECQPSRQDTPELALRLMLELLNLEQQGRHHDLVARRKALRDLHAGLYETYIRTR